MYLPLTYVPGIGLSRVLVVGEHAARKADAKAAVKNHRKTTQKLRTVIQRNSIIEREIT